MQIQVNVPDLYNKTGVKKGSVVFVKRTKSIGDKLFFGIKSPLRGIVWYAQSEVSAL
jgi:hypothetical protein